jgi:hypothetical protein
VLAACLRCYHTKRQGYGGGRCGAAAQCEWAQPKSNTPNAGLCGPSLTPLLFFTRDTTTFSNWGPGDGTPSVRVQIERGGEPNDVMRTMLAQYFVTLGVAPSWATP